MIQGSMESTNWTDLMYGVIAAGDFCFEDAEAWRYPGRIYRLLPTLHLSAELAPTNGVLVLRGRTSEPACLQISTNLLRWETHSPATNVNKEIVFTIQPASNAVSPKIFFRLQPLP
jgi:hypothetical protein